MRERRKIILQELEQTGYVKVSMLSQEFHCTEMTIRRDLNAMSEEGLLKRTHGGAVKIGKNFVTDNVKDLVYSNLCNKIYIAKMAYRIIKNGDTIFLDDATTCLYLAQEIKRNNKKSVNVITNSILLASEIMQTAHILLKVIGGDVAGNLSATVGKEALEQIRGYRVNKAFIGVNGIDYQEGITGIGYPQMEIKKAMMKRAEATYVLADSSKFGHIYLSHICNLSEVTGVLTDKDLKEEYVQIAKEKNYPIYVDDTFINRRE
ncbi:MULTISPECIES: DeoR/GlpR family DNA-binding transcription regulator [Mediterraneibacter]|uniref:DeoR/GlpR family DNA-binding transcription regulator n=1 Tax=Mediterraneibacter TaxID=2316020 RepID=UPI000E49D02B|nr:DeoR/GlpR family DNA-binding transcription regulator [Mediterraneibacter massiliensis]RGT72037.1 DeoR/GlpR transcriptional regulator [Ruminococcus sp. AF18-22]